MADKPFEIGRGQLDQSLKKVSLLGLVSRCMPESFKHFVAFPPVGVVVEIDSIKVLLCFLPLLGKEQDRFRCSGP